MVVADDMVCLCTKWASVQSVRRGEGEEIVLVWAGS